MRIGLLIATFATTAGWMFAQPSGLAMIYPGGQALPPVIPAALPPPGLTSGATVNCLDAQYLPAISAGVVLPALPRRIQLTIHHHLLLETYFQLPFPTVWPTIRCFVLISRTSASQAGPTRWGKLEVSENCFVPVEVLLLPNDWIPEPGGLRAQFWFGQPGMGFPPGSWRLQVYCVLGSPGAPAISYLTNSATITIP